MSHKRALSSGEVSSAKRSTQDIPPTRPLAPNTQIPPTAFDPRWVYIATRETSDPYAGETHEVIEAYGTIQDANWGIKGLANAEFDEEEWEETYDIDGLLSLKLEGGEGDEIELRVERIPMRAVGSVPPPPSAESEGEEGDENEENVRDDQEADEEEEEEEGEGEGEDEDEEEEAYDETAEIKQAQRRGGRPVDCRGTGCGEPLCSSCWPQTEEEWEGFH